MSEKTKFFLSLPDGVPTPDVEAFGRKAIEIVELYAKKNKDYGNAFSTSFAKWGMMYLLSRLDDKLNRLITITKNGNSAVSSESAMDTLMDLAAYSIMGIVEIQKEMGEQMQEEDDTV